MADLKNFTFGEITLHTQVIDNDPYFLAKDVCKALDHSNYRKALKDHVFPEDVTKRYTLTAGGKQQALWINESGLYALIFGSKLENAKKFKHWVTAEVLPSIRKTGGYTTGAKKAEREYLEWKHPDFLKRGRDLSLRVIIDSGLWFNVEDFCKGVGLSKFEPERYALDTKDLLSFDFKGQSGTFISSANFLRILFSYKGKLWRQYQDWFSKEMKAQMLGTVVPPALSYETERLPAAKVHKEQPDFITLTCPFFKENNSFRAIVGKSIWLCLDDAVKMLRMGDFRLDDYKLRSEDVRIYEFNSKKAVFTNELVYLRFLFSIDTQDAITLREWLITQALPELKRKQSMNDYSDVKIYQAQKTKPEVINKEQECFVLDLNLTEMSALKALLNEWPYFRQQFLEMSERTETLLSFIEKKLREDDEQKEMLRMFKHELDEILALCTSAPQEIDLGLSGVTMLKNELTKRLRKKLDANDRGYIEV